MTVGFTVAGTASGAGKTTVTLGLLRLLRRRGLKVAPFKAGPDYIDPGLHRLAAGRPSRNLDSWMMPWDTLAASFAHAAHGADVALLEGVMGLFDGAGDGTGRGSTASLAKGLGLPVLLVVDASGMAGSVAAVVHGFATLDPDLRIAGVVLNRVAGASHLEHLADAIRPTGVPLLGHLGRDADIAIPSRHLGLTTAEDLADHTLFERLADHVEAGLDLDALLAAAAPVATRLARHDWPPPRVRLGVARDAAFCFAYPDTLDALAQAGAEIVPFSPLAEVALPDGLDGLYLPGGYPELAAAALSANGAMLGAVRAACAGGMPVFAECGGLIYLSQGIHTTDGRFFPFCGVLPAPCRMNERRVALGYRTLTVTGAGPLGEVGAELKGHEFRYSEVDRDALAAHGVATTLRLTDRLGRGDGGDGYRVHNTWASYAHVLVTDPVARHWVALLEANRR
ncbi:MAG: cobyrinate a,c-diamide synthase [Nitrospirae bacterium]|nr:cobyrinate a,c-diamide synthase [Nitrospirota bacterium]